MIAEYKTNVIRLLSIFVLIILFCLAAGAKAGDQELSAEFTKTYHAYNNAYAQGDMVRAAELAGKAVQLAKKELGEDHEKTAIMQVNHAHALVLIGETEKAEPIIEQAQKILLKFHGTDDPTFVTIHEDLAKIYASKKELEKSRLELSKAISILVKDDEKKHDLEIANYLVQQGTLDIAANKVDSAITVYNKALSIYEIKYGKRSPRSANILSLLGDVDLLQKKFTSAENYYKEALAIFEEKLLQDDPAVIASNTKLAKMYIAMNDSRFAPYADKVIVNQKFQEGAALPLFVIQPKYPVFKSGEKPVGWVLLEFTVTENGRIKNAKIMESRPAKLFDKVTLDAAVQWRFKPKIQDGKRVAQENSRARIVFKQDNIEVHLGEIAKS